MSEILRVSGLGRAYGQSNALEGVSFALERGDRLVVMGRSGSGKTTLLRLVAGLEAPTTGEIAIEGRLASQGRSVRVPPERRGVALVFQGLALFPHLRVLDQVAFASRGRGGLERAKVLLDRVGLRHRADARLDELSGGERQRIALARALAQGPELLLMDEPFAGLDDENRGAMRDLLRSLLERTETTLILVTHSRDDAFDLARRAIVFDRGRIAADDLLEALLIRPRHAAAVRALGFGQLIEGMATAQGDAETAFGMVRTSPGTKPGPAVFLVRPEQPILAEVGEGVVAEILAIELQPSAGREVRRVAVVRVANQTLRVIAGQRPLTTGETVRVRIDGECDPVDG